MGTHAGALAVKRVGGVPTVFPAEGGHVKPEENLLRVVYDHGPVNVRVSNLSPSTPCCRNSVAVHQAGT